LNASARAYLRRSASGRVRFALPGSGASIEFELGDALQGVGFRGFDHPCAPAASSLGWRVQPVDDLNENRPWKGLFHDGPFFHLTPRLSALSGIPSQRVLTRIRGEFPSCIFAERLGRAPYKPRRPVPRETRAHPACSWSASRFRHSCAEPDIWALSVLGVALGCSLSPLGSDTRVE